MTPVTDPATADSRVARLYPSPLNIGTFDLDTLTLTADSIVRDILQIVAAGRIDDDARAAFRDWIVDAWLALPTAVQLEQLCQAAGFASVVAPATLKARLDELRDTLAGLRQELAQAHERLALLNAAGQAIVATWDQGDLAYVVRRLAALTPK